MQTTAKTLSDVPAINRFLSYCRVRTVPGHLRKTSTTWPILVVGVVGLSLLGTLTLLAYERRRRMAAARAPSPQKGGCARGGRRR